MWKLDNIKNNVAKIAYKEPMQQEKKNENSILLLQGDKSPILLGHTHSNKDPD